LLALSPTEMNITVNIYAYLRYYLPASQKSTLEKEWNMPEGATVGHVLEKLRLPKEIRVTVLVNNNSVDLKAVLKDGDILHILPQMVGG
jgi:molybdopterin converting factor small subunit